MRIQQIVEWFRRHGSSASEEAGDIDCTQVSFGTWRNPAEIISTESLGSA